MDAPPLAVKVVGQRWEAGRLEESRDLVASETAVALHYNHRPHVVMMMTPRDIEDFVLGFSLSEGILREPSELGAVHLRALADGIECDAAIALERYAELDARQRNLAGRTGCGLCGAETLQQAVRELSPVADSVRMTHAALQSAMVALGRRQPLNAATGAVHAAAWTDTGGSIQLVREDVGRHNALDKLIGALARGGTDLTSGFVLMSSRCSFELVQKCAIALCRAGIATDNGALLITSRASHEMVQKAAALGMQIVCAISAPTSLAIRQAQQNGVTLAGFARGGRHTVYTNAARLT
jgi:FdhD protein